MSALPEMTYDEMLDEILVVLLHMRNSKEHTDNTGYIINDIAEGMGFELEEGEGRTLEDILVDDGYVERFNNGSSNIVNITPKGTNFIMQGGYRRQATEKSRKRKMDYVQVKLAHSTIKTNTWKTIEGKVALVISILALMVSVIALWKSIFK